MDILHSIVSRLPMRQAVMTSILSKHWKHVWCSRTNLEFSFKSLVYKNGSQIPRSHLRHLFIPRVDAVLRQHSGVGVEKLEVDYSPLHNEHTEHIDRWVNFAISSKTKQLILDFQAHYLEKEPYTFHLQLFDATNGSHLQYLKLGSISLKPPASIKFFLNLKKLELVDVDITNEELKLLLRSCNVLEFIGISRCKMLTRLYTSHPMNRINHLQVSHCPLLEGIELHFGLITLEYEGLVIPFEPPSTLRNVSIEISEICSSLAYMFTELPSTLRHIETLTLRGQEYERAFLPNMSLNFLYVRHLRLELNFVHQLEPDVLDLAFILQAAPTMEKLEIHMLMDHRLQRYRKCHGKLRRLALHPHSHLKLVDITGFYGQKAQIELARHILRNSVMLKTKIDPKPKPTIPGIVETLYRNDGLRYVDGYKLAKKYLRRVDHHGVLSLVKVRRRDVKNVNPYHLIGILDYYDYRWPMNNE